MCPLTQRKGVFFGGGGGYFKFRVLYPQSTIEFNRSARSIAPHKRAREKRARERERQRPTFFDGERSKTREDRRPKNATTTTTPPPFAGYIKRGTLFKRSAEDFGRRRFDCRSAD